MKQNSIKEPIKFQVFISMVNLKERKVNKIDLGIFRDRETAREAATDYINNLSKGDWQFHSFKFVQREMNKKMFDIFNKEQEKKGLPKLKNRNIPLEFETIIKGE
ncbi:hypothetical protein EDC44_10929 [Cricetibacter osteomyelitidis]|uniref:Uncharacterized protein n=1 Tax=Cricetibacter osteomyelitidis TaxID=1521931 RepID=A0A4R2SXV8_9PAST|nr:hypothetical protein [Cricetibacter osteomyelitidis]TCP95337.1 hypothetical protein EDC44_10929 [Cricetibacter osteomyelitidis]